jgi:hypothetical protein
MSSTAAADPTQGSNSGEWHLCAARLSKLRGFAYGLTLVQLSVEEKEQQEEEEREQK